MARMEKQIKQFLDFLQNEKRVSNNTLQSYSRDIHQYESYVSQNKINSYLRLFKLLHLIWWQNTFMQIFLCAYF